MMFRDQVGVLAGWFKGWNECEQTVALLSLLKRVSRTQARFLQLCLEHSLADCTELHILEGEANNPGECWRLLRPFSGGALMPSEFLKKKKMHPRNGCGLGAGGSPSSVAGTASLLTFYFPNGVWLISVWFFTVNYSAPWRGVTTVA